MAWIMIEHQFEHLFKFSDADHPLRALILHSREMVERARPERALWLQKRLKYGLE
jgi:hypothetical protein